nr:MAG TPA: hypothetical protein [Caudoviricetes sp.]
MPYPHMRNFSYLYSVKMNTNFSKKLNNTNVYINSCL